MNRFQRVLVGVIVVLVTIGTAAATLDFRLARTETNTHHTFSKTSVDTSGEKRVLTGQRVFLHVEDRAGLGGALAWEMRRQLQAVFGSTVTLLNNAPGPDDFPIVLVAVRDEKGFWTPFYARKSVTVLGTFASYTSDIAVDWSEIVSIDRKEATGGLPLFVQMQFKVETRSAGIVSLPAFRKKLLQDAPREFVEYLRKSIQEVEAKAASTAAP